MVGIRSMPGNPYDGHTLAETIEQVEFLTDRTPTTVIADRGYKGAELKGIQVLRSGQKRGISRTLHAMIKRRSAIKPTIGHMTTDGRETGSKVPWAMCCMPWCAEPATTSDCC